MSNLAIIAPDYLEAFKALYNSEFIKLIDFVIQEKGRNFFPTVGELKSIEDMLSYNPYGGSGGLPFAEIVTEELVEEAEKPAKPMSEENKQLLADLLQKIGEEMPD